MAMTRADGCRLAWSPGEHMVEMAMPEQSAPLSQRAFLLLVPSRPRYVRGRLPLVLDFHGHSESPMYQDKLVGMGEAVERYGWLGAIPFGTAPRHSRLCCPPPERGCSAANCSAGRCLDRSNPCSWNTGPRSAGGKRGADDVGFTRHMIRWLARNACADEDAVFATGFSNGASFVLRLGCEASELFRAIAPGSGCIRRGGDRKRTHCPTKP